MATLVSSVGVTLPRGPQGSRASIRSNTISPMLVQSPDEDVTITGNRTLANGKRKSIEELQLLALSSQITEISYSLSDIQTRIFEIQELRHQAEANAPAALTFTASVPGEVGDGPITSTPGGTGVTTLDQALIGLEERLEAISGSVASVDETLGPHLKDGGTPTQATPNMSTGGELLTALLRKHAELKAEWESVQKEAETLQSELREDKWLAVFRSVGEQSDTMMNSLEKALANCQTFIYQVHRGAEDTMSQGSSSGMLADKPLNLEVFQSLLASYESKKKYYVPSISKVLGILDRTVRDRITKNGECLRTHAEARARWRSVQGRMARIDMEMENVRQILIQREREPEPSETGSAVSRITNKTSKSGHYLSTPSSTTRSRTGSTVSAALQRSMSPLRKMASKVTGSLRTSGRSTPAVSAATSPLMSATGAAPKPPPKSPYRTQGNKVLEEPNPPVPARSATGSTRKRDSYFPFLSKDPAASTSTIPNTTSAVPPSVSPGSRPSSRLSSGNDPTGMLRPRWNPSTKVEPVSNTPAVPRRSFQTTRPHTPSNRVERPATSQAHYSPSRPSLSRPQSRAGAQTPFDSGTTISRPRPNTPSHIPGPSVSRPSSAASQVGPTSLMQRALSPMDNTTMSVRSHSRQQSRSLIPAPKLNLSPPSRPGSSMSNGPLSAVTTSSTGALAPQTGGAGATLYGGASPDHTPTRNLPAAVGISASRLTPSRAAPSSFKSASAFTPSPVPNFGGSTPSRPGSRSSTSGGSFTPMLADTPVYVPIKWDELDMEVAKVVNGLPHGFTFERLDPPTRKPAANAPKPDEIRGQYAVSNALSRKVITCRLTNVGRGGNMSKKIMCRVGGGWLDLQMYILNRQAGLQ